MRKVKIVATIGPASEKEEVLEDLILAGMDVARLNFSHGTEKGHENRFRTLREVSKRCNRPLGILADLGGPKIRLGMVEPGTEVSAGSRVTLYYGPDSGLEEERGYPGGSREIEQSRDAATRLPHTYEPLAREVGPGQRIVIDDGRIELAVEAVERGRVHCKVIAGGPVSSHKGMNLPGCRLSAPALTDKDRADLDFAKRLGVDFFALSFVRRAEEVEEAKELAGAIPVIAKIEKPEAVENLDGILDAADGVMVARGDLGVEVGHEKVPLLQKRIIMEANKRAKPVITATQMLDSMEHSPSPTRAEVSDVANAVLDGTDALMLSGETAAGRFPVKALETMHKIACEVESSEYYSTHMKEPQIGFTSFSNAIADAAAEVARTLNLAAIAVYTESGRSAALVSAHRPRAHVIAFSRHESVLRRMCLNWGVRPIFGEWVRGMDAILRQVEQELVSNDIAGPGDEIAVTFGHSDLDAPFQTTTLKLWRIR